MNQPPMYQIVTPFASTIESIKFAWFYDCSIQELELVFGNQRALHRSGPKVIIGTCDGLSLALTKLGLLRLLLLLAGSPLLLLAEFMIELEAAA